MSPRKPVTSQLLAAVLLALGAPAAFAATTITTTQVPGMGLVASPATTAPTATLGSNNTATITVGSGATVIDWGVTTGSTLFSAGTAGFNVGASAGVVFSNSTSDAASVLNVDVSGNPSVIDGRVNATAGTSADAPTIFIANANGIVVGGSASFVAPNGLGLINADLSGTHAQALFTSAGAIPLSFTAGVSGGVSIGAGVRLANVGSFLLVAGADTINIGNTTDTALLTAPLIVDGGVGGYFQGSTFTASDSGSASTTAVSTSDYRSFVYQDAPTTVSLDLGASTAAFTVGTGSKLYAYGDVNLSGNITSMENFSAIDWSGTLTNSGSIAGTGFGSDVENASLIYGNQTGSDPVPLVGGIVNTGTLSFPSLDILQVSSFSNSGTISLASGGNLLINVTQGNLNLGGTVSAGTGALSSLTLIAGSTLGQTININATLPPVTDTVNIAATNLNIDSSIAMPMSGSGTFSYIPVGSGAMVLAENTVSIGSSGSIMAPTIDMATQALSPLSPLSSLSWLSSLSPLSPLSPQVASSAYTNLRIDGSVTANTMTLGDQVTDVESAINNVSGAGSITANNLDFSNMIGSLNNITSGQILANGFQLNAGSAGMLNLSVTLDGAHPQGFNAKVNGDVTVDSGKTTISGTNAYGTDLVPPNAGSRFVLQTNKNMTVNPVINSSGAVEKSDKLFGAASDGIPAFQMPGLVYLLANQSLNVTTAIDAAYTANAPVGYGIWLLSPVINDLSPIYANGNRGVNFMSPTYGYATSINGVDPAVSSVETTLINGVSGQNLPLPSVYFFQPSTSIASLIDNVGHLYTMTPTFVNSNNYLQQEQTFLIMP